MSFFSSIGHFFEHLFGGNGSIFESVLDKLSHLINASLPIVEEISAIVSGIDMANHSAVLDAISKYLATAVKDEAAVAAWLTANASLPVYNLLHEAATFVLAHTSGVVSTVVRDLDTAVQIAYSVFSAKSAAK